MRNMCLLLSTCCTLRLVNIWRHFCPFNALFIIWPTHILVKRTHWKLMKPNICVRIVRLQLYQINVAGIRRSADLHSPYDTLYDTLWYPYDILFQPSLISQGSNHRRYGHCPTMSQLRSLESLHFFWDCFPLTGKTMSCKTHLCFAIRFPMFDQFLTFLQFVIKTEMPSTG